MLRGDRDVIVGLVGVPTDGRADGADVGRLSAAFVDGAGRLEFGASRYLAAYGPLPSLRDVRRRPSGDVHALGHWEFVTILDHPHHLCGQVGSFFIQNACFKTNASCLLRISTFNSARTLTQSLS